MQTSTPIPSMFSAGGWRRRCVLGLTTLLALASTACDEKDPFKGSLKINGEVATDRALVFNDVGRDELRFLRPDGEDLKITTRKIGDERDVVQWVTPTRDRQSLLALNVPADEKQEEVEERLLRFDDEGERNPIEYEVLSAFDAIALTPDWRRGVLYFGGSGFGPISNANQVAIVELTSDAGVVRTLTLNGFGGRLERVQFPAQLAEGEVSTVQIGSAARDLVAFLAAGEIVLVDMDDPQADQVAVNFRDGGLSGTPVDTLLRAGNDLFDDPVLFVRSATDNDVALLTLIDKPDEETGAPGFSAQVGLLDGGSGITDFVAYDGEDVPYLITVSASGLRFTDIRTFDSFDVEVPGQVTNIELRDAEKGNRTIKQAVLWKAGGAAVYTLDLDDIESTVGRKPHPLNVQQGIADVVFLDNDRLLVGSYNYLYVLDIPLDQVTPLPTQIAYDPRVARLEGDTLILGAVGSQYVSTVDLRDLNPESMVLDYPTSRFYYLADPGQIIAVHEADEGLLTLVDGADPSRSTSRVEWGYLLNGVLDDA